MQKQERSRQQVIPSPLDTAITHKRCSFLGSIAFTCTVGQRRESEAAKLLQQGLHLALHGGGSSRTMLLIYRLQQLVKAGGGIAKVKVAEDPRKRGRGKDACLI